MRKVLLTLGMGLMLAFVLTACGPEPDVSSSSSVASSTSSSSSSSSTSSTSSSSSSSSTSSTSSSSSSSSSTSSSAPSTDASLSDLKLDGTTVSGFSPTVYAYSGDTRPLTNTTVIIEATTADANATVSGDGSQTISDGTNDLTVTVTAEDGTTTQDYTITIIAYDKMTVNLSFTSITNGDATYLFLTGDKGYLHKDGSSTWTPDNGLVGAVSDSNASVSFEVPVSDFGVTIQWKALLGTAWADEQLNDNQNLVVTDPVTNITLDWSTATIANSGTVYDGIGTVSFDASTYDIAAGAQTVSVTVFDVDTNVASMVVNVSNTNSAASFDVTLTKTPGTYEYEGSLTVDTASADLVVSNNDVLTASYNDVQPAGTSTAYATVLYVPSYTVDGLVSSEYTLLGTGGGSSWGAIVGNVYVTSTTNTLFVAVQFSVLPNANNIYIVVDDTNMASGLATLGDFTSGWGDVGLLNDISIEPDFATWGWCGGDGTLNWSGANLITNAAGGAAAGVSQAQDISSTPGTYEFAVPYSQIGSGSSAGDAVGIYVFFGKDNGNGGIHSTYPVMNTDNPCTNVDVASATYTLQ